MDLYYSPLACSLAAHVVCLEAALPVTLRRVALFANEIDEPELSAHNPMRQVPTLVCTDGTVLTEAVAVLLYLGDRDPARRLVPADGTAERYAVIRWTSFVATELHKQVNAVLFTPTSPAAVKDHARAQAVRPLSVLDRALATRDHLVGDAFTIADAYLCWALTIMPFGGVALAPYPALQRYLARHSQRPSLQAALRRERAEYAA